MANKDRHFLAKRGTAALVACIVEVLRESDPTFRARFLSKLDELYEQARDLDDAEGVEEMELFRWTREIVLDRP